MPDDLLTGGLIAADRLTAELDAAPEWPLPREQRAIEQCRWGRALRRNDAPALKRLAGWESLPENLDRPYICDALPRRITLGYADFLFSEDPAVLSGEQSPKGYVEIAKANKLTARLHRAERICVSEGEAWWKLHRNPMVADVPLISWASRARVVPLWYGDRPIAAAFWEEVGREMGTDDEGLKSPDVAQIIFRRVELHAAGVVRNLLYRGQDDALGDRVPLTEHLSTMDFPPEFKHGMPMWAGRVTNDLDDDDTLGEPEFTTGVRGMCMALNEAITIGTENARVTGKHRVFMEGKFTRQDGSFDASVEVFQVEGGQATLGETGGAPPVVAVDLKYDAEPLWLHIDNMTRRIVADVGMVPEWIMGDAEGRAESGTAIRLRFLPMTNAASGKLREWSTELPHILGLMLGIGTGRATGGAMVEDLVVEFGDPLPQDTSEQVTDHALAVGAGIESRETAVRDLHPDWDDTQVKDELKKIADDEPEPVAPMPAPADPVDPADPPEDQ